MRATNVQSIRSSAPLVASLVVYHSSNKMTQTQSTGFRKKKRAIIRMTNHATGARKTDTLRGTWLSSAETAQSSITHSCNSAGEEREHTRTHTAPTHRPHPAHTTSVRPRQRALIASLGCSRWLVASLRRGAASSRPPLRSELRPARPRLCSFHLHDLPRGRPASAR